MGNQSSQSVVERQLYKPEEYTQALPLNDLRYGSVKILENKSTNQKVAEMVKTTNNEQQWQQRVEELKFRIALDHPNIVKLVNFNSQKHNELCSTFFKTGILYEYYTNDLKTEISERKRTNIRYTEGELLYVLHSIASVVLYLKSKNATHGDIRPYNILVNDVGQVKLGEVYTSQQKVSNYSLLLTGQTEDCYVSPQLLENLKRNNPNPVFDAHKNEVFALGMTLLEASTLEQVGAQCYLKDQCVLDQNKLQALLQQVRLSYSNNYHQLLSKMLLENETERLSIEQLLQELDNQQWVKQQECKNISTLEIIEQQRSAPVAPVKPIVIPEQSPQVETYVRYEQPANNYVVQQNQTVITTTNYSNLSDLDARVEAVLKMSRETVEKYGTSGNYQTSSYTTTTYNAPVVIQQEGEEVIKKSGRVIENVSYNPVSVNYAPLSSYEVYQPQTVTYQTSEEVVKRSLPQVQAFNTEDQNRYYQAQSYSYNPQNVQVTDYQNNYGSPIQSYQVASEEVVKRSGKQSPDNGLDGYKVTYQSSNVVGGNVDNMSVPEREAYIQKILSEARQISQGNQNNTNYFGQQ